MLLTVPAAITAGVLPALEDEVALAETDPDLAASLAWAAAVLATARTSENGTLTLDVPAGTCRAAFDDFCALHEGPDRTGLADYEKRIGWLQLASAYQQGLGGPAPADLRTADEQMQHFYEQNPDAWCRAAGVPAEILDEFSASMAACALIKAGDAMLGRVSPEWEAAHAESCALLDTLEACRVPPWILDALVRQAQAAPPSQSTRTPPEECKQEPDTGKARPKSTGQHDPSPEALAAGLASLKRSLERQNPGRRFTFRPLDEGGDD